VILEVKRSFVGTGRNMTVFILMCFGKKRWLTDYFQNTFFGCIEKIPSEIHLKAGREMIASPNLRQDESDFSVGELL